MHDNLEQTLLEPASGLRYRVRAGSTGQGKAPCLILLHGVGANEMGLIDLARQLDPRLTVLLVRGPLEFGPMQFGWFQVSFTPNGPSINPAQAELARTRLLRFIEQLAQSEAIDPARIAIAGFSQGGIMSASVGLTAPGKVAGFAILSGRILPEILPLVPAREALGKLRAFVSHGIHDQKLGIHFAHQAKQVLAGLGVAVAYHEYPAGHSLEPAMIGDFKQWLDEHLIATSAAHQYVGSRT